MYEQFLKTLQAPQQPELWTNPWRTLGTVGSTAAQQSMALQRQWAEQFAGLFSVNDTTRKVTLEMIENTSKLYLASLEGQIGWWRTVTAFWPSADDTAQASARKRTPADRQTKGQADQPEIKLELVGNTPEAVVRDDVSDPLSWDAKDDLKQIAGIGPGLERKLNEEGILNFRQIAEFTKSDIARLEKTVIKFPGRIERDGWVAQAKKLAAAQ